MADHLNSAMKQTYDLKLTSCFHLPCIPKFYFLREGEMRWQIKKYKCHAITWYALRCLHTENALENPF
jgi:hypothetical protein